MRVHPVTSEASVVRRTRVIAILSGSSALAEETDTITSSPTHFAVAFTGSFRGPVLNYRNSFRSEWARGSPRSGCSPRAGGSMRGGRSAGAGGAVRLGRDSNRAVGPGLAGRGGAVDGADTDGSAGEPGAG